MDITLRMSDHALTARAAAAAGIVLLKNTAGTLPLLPAEDGAPLPVAVFGIRQLLTPAYDRAMTPWRAIGVLDGLMASDAIRPDGLLARKYRTWAMEHPDGSELPLTNVDFGALRHDCAAAVVVIGRTPEQDHTRLTSEETAMLTRVTSVFDRTILVLAAPGYIELNAAALACGAIVFLGLAGQEAGGALADVLTAKVMPSGHLSFTWPENAEAFDEACAAVDQFTGYRYFDSFGTPVRYPFGYGLGYGKIEFGSVSAGLDGCDVTVSAELVNTGETHAASELMQVYVTRPGDDLTRPVSFLQAFSKSRLLAPGESQTIRLRFPITDLAVYRESAHAFVLDAGYYDIRIGTSSRAGELACSFDPDVIRAVGRAVGLEMAEFGVQLWLGPDANVMRAPQKKGCAEQWSEDPVVCGTMTAALAAGAWPYGAVVLHAGRLPENAAVSQAALREVYGRPFELAAGVCRAARLPETSISGRTLTENSPLLRAWLLDCGYGGMLWGDRTLAGDRIGLEKAALRILRLILQLKKA